MPNRTTSALYTPAPEVSGLKSLAVNGETISPKIENGYAAITRTWKAGDTIDLVLPMKVQVVKADEKVAADRGRVALRYGPLIYNVERADQPDINLALGSAPLTPEWRGDLLDGVMAIKGAVGRRQSAAGHPEFRARKSRRKFGRSGLTARNEQACWQCPNFGTYPESYPKNHQKTNKTEVFMMKSQAVACERHHAEGWESVCSRQIHSGTSSK